MRHIYSLKYIITIALIVLFLKTNAQLPYNLPAVQDTAQFGKYLQRTMKLLATSTPTYRNTVKILVYGQSIAKQEWSDTVRMYLKKRFPYANIIMINRAIGGCWAGCLQNPTEYDVNTFYPDLILFDVYGWGASGGNQGTEYHNIIQWMRKYTTAEIAMQNHHITPGDAGNAIDNSDFIKMSKDYGVELIDVRTPWRRYLTDNSKNPIDLTADGTHLNAHGNFLMARLYLPYLQYKPQLNPDTFQLVTSYKVGQDVFFVDGKLTLPFNGNKVDFVNAAPTIGADSAKILIDTKKPSVIPGTVMFTRPNEPYDTVFKHFSLYDWPWQKGAIMKFTKPTFNPKPETWTLEFLTYTAANSFTFKVTGSKTGLDGNGTANINSSLASSGSVFNSNSGTVVFNPKDFWFDKGPYTPLALAPGFKIVWQARAFFTDTFIPNATNPNTFIDSTVTIAQGITNDNHLLEITSLGNKNTPIKEIRIYRPYLNRTVINFEIPTSNLVQTITLPTCLGISQDLTTLFSDTKSVPGVVTYWQNETATLNVSNPNLITLAGDYFIKKQAIVGGRSSILKIIIPKNCGADIPKSVTGIETQILNSRVTIYPNPSNGIFYIQTKDQNPITIEVYNALGNIMLKTNNLIIDLTNQSKGLYFFRISLGSSQIIRKVLVE